jgi:hypothetical protein
MFRDVRMCECIVCMKEKAIKEIKYVPQENEF